MSPNPAILSRPHVAPSMGGISGLSKQIWLRASDLSVGTVSTWADQSGSARHATGVNSPQCVAAATPSGGKAIDFNNLPYFTLPDLGIGAAAEVWLVVYGPPNGVNTGLWDLGASGTGVNHYPYSGTIYDSSFTDSRTGFTPTMAIQDTWRIYRVANGGAVYPWTVWLDNVQQAAMSTPIINPLAPRIGSSPTAQFAFTGKFAEFFVRPVVSTGPEVEQIMTYFAAQHGIIMPRHISDSFDRPNQSGLGVTDTGQSWIESGPWSILGNAAQGYGRALVEFGQADQIVTARYGSLRSQGNGPSMNLRYVDANNRYEFWSHPYAGWRSRMYQWIGGVQVDLSGELETPPINDQTTAPPAVVSAVEEAGGTRLRVVYNGVLQWEMLDTAVGRPSGTKAGIEIGYDNAQNAVFLDWKVESP